MNDFTFNWITETPNVPALVNFFLQNVDDKYISFGEYQSNLATPGAGWAPDIEQKLLLQMQTLVANAKSPNPRALLAQAKLQTTLQAIAVVRFNLEGPFRSAHLEDIVVARQTTTQGTGTKFLNWLESECRLRGATHLTLETGATNDHAAKFFTNRGFTPISVVRIKQL
jgi:ribosomal protein S18 acetylase RimI-like enzyme